MAASLLALIDDITTVLDDVSVLAKVATQKTVGVLGDDLALNAQQVAGVNADRELPVVWAVFKGSCINKAILVPAALAISAFIPWAVTPLLMAGGIFLCFEGFEKLAHKFMHVSPEQTDGGGHTDSMQGQGQGDGAQKAMEKNKVKGAVRTDFILSSEIIAITLGTVQEAAFITQFAVLAGVAALMTVGVYGLVAGIVKLDDAGLYLSRIAGKGSFVRMQRAIGRAILFAAPWFMRALSIAGTVAMFLVGGGILAHGIPAVGQAIEAVAERAGSWGGGVVEALTPHLLDGLLGLAAGGLALLAWTLVLRLRGSRQPALPEATSAK